jgi:putative DNA primase/helicase
MAEGATVITGVFGDGVRRGSGGPSPERLARFPFNDLGNAMRLITLAGGAVGDDGAEVDATDSVLLFLLGHGWVGFNGKFWDRKFGEDLARKLAHQVAGQLRGLWPIVETTVYGHLKAGAALEAAAAGFRKFATQAGSSGATTAMLKQAESYLKVELDAFDRDPLALNVTNGTLKLSWTAEGGFRVQLARHDPADRITRCAAVAYEPEAEAPTFRRVLADSLRDASERAYFARVLGYAATGCAEEQAFFLCQGRGRDGKSTLLDACREALGTYAVAASPQTFLEAPGARGGDSPRPDLIALSGDTRLAVLSEPPRGSKLDEGQLKAWTSGSPISARDLHGKPINFRPRAKLIWECNAFPVAKGDDDGIWRRIYPSLFRHQVPKEKVDKTLPKQLLGELPGVLNWLLEGAGDWLATGGLSMPETLGRVVEDYRRSSSPFGDWLAECCVLGEAAAGERVLSGELFESFKKWAEDQGIEKIMSARAFGDALRDRQILVMGKDAKGRKYRGPVRLKTEDERRSEAAAGDAALAAEAGGFDPADVPPPGGVGDLSATAARYADDGFTADPDAFDPDAWGGR